MNKTNNTKQESNKSVTSASLLEEKLVLRKNINDVLTNEKLLVNKNFQSNYLKS
jgi:hypothetical protein